MSESKKLRVALLFGGCSSEHSVSCVSASAWLNAMQQPPCGDKYEVIPVGITDEGRWLRYTGLAEHMADNTWEAYEDCCIPCILSPDRTDHGLLLLENGVCTRLPVDVAVPVLHGKNGEDGTIQGLLELSGIPYVGCGVLASAACMDKEYTNTLMDANGIPHCRWCSGDRTEAERHLPALLERVENRLDYPIFVKPANAGSSVGISKAHNRDELVKAIEVALKEDHKVIFEEFIDGQEVECAAIGNPEDPDSVDATRPGEILAGAEFYTYDDKYKNGVSETVMTANLPEQKLDEVRTLAIKAYRALNCTGLSRCDFFVERSTGRVLCNEINTMPGFTSISMYPKLMEAHRGLTFSALCDRLIGLALAKRKGAY